MPLKIFGASTLLLCFKQLICTSYYFVLFVFSFVGANLRLLDVLVRLLGRLVGVRLGGGVDVDLLLGLFDFLPLLHRFSADLEPEPTLWCELWPCGLLILFLLTVRLFR